MTQARPFAHAIERLRAAGLRPTRQRLALVRLLFDRQDDGGCSEEVMLPDFGIKKFLPAFEQTAIEFTPEQSGLYEFTCGMSMLRGKLIVE